jgi:hypothetical protein
VTRLEIDRLYGGVVLARVFPFVVPASEYAGRLSGFNTHGSDPIYLATDLGPFLLTLLPGVWALRRAATARRPALFGAALPFALAPFLSLGGDAYEIGSILATRLPPWASPAMRQLLRGDDVAKKLGELAQLSNPPWGGALLAALLGAAWAFLTYALGGAVARALGSPPLTADRADRAEPGGAAAEP